MSPLQFSFLLVDAEGDPASIAVYLEQPGGAVVRANAIGGDTEELATGAIGVVHRLSWDFDGELSPTGLTGTYRFIVVADGATPVANSQNSALVEVSNDPPAIVSASVPLGESSSNVDVTFVVSDTSSDVVDVRVEFKHPERGWLPARPAGTPETEPTPPAAFVDIRAEREGTPLVFVWDTQADLSGRDLDTTLRAVADDGVNRGAFLETDSLRVDNNSEPTAFVEGGFLLANSDSRGAIAVPLNLVDDEGDGVDVILQWRRPDQSFPDLPESRAVLESVLADPDARRQYQICTEAPRTFGGQVGVLPDGADPLFQVRLPEIARGESSLLARSMDGHVLEILSPPSPPSSLVVDWKEEVGGLVSVLPSEDPEHLLVLEESGHGSWRLAERERSTGAVVREIATSSSGRPTAMTHVPGRSSLLVAADHAGEWSVERIDLISGARLADLTVEGNEIERGSVRGIASLGTTTCVVTVGSSLIQVSFPEVGGEAQFRTVRRNLIDPRGLVRDPASAGHVLVAEKGFRESDSVVVPPLGRILRVDVATGDADRFGGLGGGARPDFPRVEALAIGDADGSLLILTDRDPFDGSKEVLECDRRGVETRSSIQVPVGVESVARGVDRETFFVVPCENDVVRAGPEVQRRALVSHDNQVGSAVPYDPATRVATVTEPFDPIPRAGWTWRVHDFVLRDQNSAPGGKVSYFLWDSSDVGAGGPVSLRAHALDPDRGVPADMLASKVIEGHIDREPRSLKVPSLDPSLAQVEDLNGDELPDLVLRDGGNLTIVWQESSGGFDPVPLTLGPASAPVVLADLDSNGLTDVAAIRTSEDKIVAYLQTSPGTFGRTLELGEAQGVDTPRSLTVHDVDSDAILDLLIRNDGDQSIAIFFGTGSGFEDPPLLIPDGLYWARPLVGDTNNDGLMDLVVGDYSSVYVIEQTETRVFGRPFPLEQARFQYFGEAAVADMNGDGLADVVVAGAYDEWLYVYLQSVESGLAGLPQRFGGGAISSPPGGLTITDMNGDELPDVVAALQGSFGYGEDRVAVYFQTAPGVLDSFPLEIAVSVSSLLPADLNADGRPDLVARLSFGGPLVAFYATGLSSFRKASFELTLPQVAGGTVTADFDLDGLVDIATLSGADFGRVVVFHQAGPGVFDSSPQELVVAEPDGALAADVTGDGLVDIMTSSSFGCELSLFAQVAPGQFDPERRFVVSSCGGGGVPTVADMNGDGALDLVYPGLFSSSVAILHQQGSGAFEPEAAALLEGPTEFVHVTSTAAADLNSDGLVDVFVSYFDSDDPPVGDIVAHFRQVQAGAFERVSPDFVPSSAPGEPGYVFVYDIDGDSLLDVGVTNRTRDSLMLFYQDESGDFLAPPQELDGVFTLPRSDMDGDGRLDFVTQSAIHLQSAPRQFRSLPIELPGVVGYGLAVADFNADGLPDISGIQSTPVSRQLFFLADR